MVRDWKVRFHPVESCAFPDSSNCQNRAWRSAHNGFRHAAQGNASQRRPSMSAYDEQLRRQFRRRTQDRRRRRSIAKQATTFGLEAMHALIKPCLPDLSHLVAEIHRRHVKELPVIGTHHREQIDDMNDRQVGLAAPCLGGARFHGRKCGVGKVGRYQYLSRRRGPRHKDGTMRIANDMLRSVAQNAQTPMFDLSPDDHSPCSDAFGSTEYSRMHRALFDLDLCSG